MLNLNLPAFDYSVDLINGKPHIYDVIRKKYVVLTPEEWVRQHFVHYLIKIKSVSKNSISLEAGMRYNELSKRTDILVFSDTLKPQILIECKAPHVEISEQVLFQLSTYNSKIKANYLVASNGMSTLTWEKHDDGYQMIPELPQMNGTK